MSGRPKEFRIEAEEPRERQGKMTRTRSLLFPADTILEPREQKTWTLRKAEQFLNKYYRGVLNYVGNEIEDDRYADKVIEALALLMEGKPKLENQRRNIPKKLGDIYYLLLEDDDGTTTLQDLADWILMTGGKRTH
jgi:hypothetical protein